MRRRSVSRRRTHLSVRLLFAVLLLGGCGFHLRSLDVGTNIDSAYVAAGARQPLADPLRDALRQAGVAEAASRSEAAVVVELLDSRRDRRSVTVTGQARAAEYETILAVQYRVTDASGAELLAAQWLERTRVYRIDPDNIVGSSEEQTLLEREMRDDLVQQILRTLNAVTAPSATAEPQSPAPAATEQPPATPDAA